MSIYKNSSKGVFFYLFTTLYSVKRPVNFLFATCLIFYCKLLMADENQLYVQLFERWVSYIYGNVPDLGHVNRDNSLILLLSQMGYIGSVFVITMS